MSKGVPVGYKIKGWRYGPGKWTEKKVGRDSRGRGIWRFRHVSMKSRRTKGPGGPAVGEGPVWRINAIQKVRKVKRGKHTVYRTEMVGTKRFIGYQKKS